MNEISVMWFRRDLRMHDNAALYHALRSGLPVLPIFIFDTDILNQLTDRRDARLVFIHRALEQLHVSLAGAGAGLLTLHGSPLQVWKQLLSEFRIRKVFVNRDYEPYAQQRDRQVHSLLFEHGVEMKGFKDQVIFDKNEVLKDDGKPYTVYTPYSRKWKSLVNEFYLKPYPVQKYLSQLLKYDGYKMLPLSQIGFSDFKVEFPPAQVSSAVLKQYAALRDIPGVNGTSRLSVHLRFGTVSIRALVQQARAESEKWYNELIWREFYQMILYHFPHTVEAAFKPAYDRVQWLNDEAHFEAWCQGRTGYPLVDAGMRELNTTGFMHNRVRMVAASFLTKHLLIDWRWGERYFAQKLLDFELASNVGGWQWSAGCGCDAAPYFRVFNPTEQQKKFDPEGVYVRRWVPEWGTAQYPAPIVEHALARARVLQVYKKALLA